MAKAEGKISKRYARAMLELYEPAQLESVRDSLQRFAAVWEGATLLRDGLSNPAYPLKERVQVVRDIAERVRAGDAVFSNFVVVLLENSRLGAIAEISRVFSSMVDELKRRLSLEITSAYPVEESEKRELAQRIEREFGSLAALSWKVQPEILGGLIIKAGDRLLDTSVNGALESLQESLLG